MLNIYSFNLVDLHTCHIYVTYMLHHRVVRNYIEDITRWREDMNFIFKWQNNILRTRAASRHAMFFLLYRQKDIEKNRGK